MGLNKFQCAFATEQYANVSLLILLPIWFWCQVSFCFKLIPCPLCNLFYILDRVMIIVTTSWSLIFVGFFLKKGKKDGNNLRSVSLFQIIISLPNMLGLDLFLLLEAHILVLALIRHCIHLSLDETCFANGWKATHPAWDKADFV